MLISNLFYFFSSEVSRVWFMVEECSLNFISFPRFLPFREFFVKLTELAFNGLADAGQAAVWKSLKSGKKQACAQKRFLDSPPGHSGRPPELVAGERLIKKCTSLGKSVTMRSC